MQILMDTVTALGSGAYRAVYTFLSPGAPPWPAVLLEMALKGAVVVAAAGLLSCILKSQHGGADRARIVERRQSDLELSPEGLFEDSGETRLERNDVAASLHFSQTFTSSFEFPA